MSYSPYSVPSRCISQYVNDRYLLISTWLTIFALRCTLLYAVVLGLQCKDRTIRSNMQVFRDLIVLIFIVYV